MGEITVTKSFSIAPQNFEQANHLAEIIAESAFCPSAFKNKPGDVLCAIQFATELGLQPMQGLQNIAVINGKPSLYGDASLAIIRQHPAFVSIEERDPTEALAKGEGLCSIVVRHAAGTTTVTRRFTMTEAEKAGLKGKQGPWSQYPGRMLQMRARSFAMRDAIPEALKGLSIAEEAQDFEPIHATARTVPAAISQATAPKIETVNTETGEVAIGAAPKTHDPAPSKVDDFADRLSECTTTDQVKAISKEIGVAGLSKDPRLVAAYKDSMARIGGAAK